MIAKFSLEFHKFNGNDESEIYDSFRDHELPLRDRDTSLVINTFRERNYESSKWTGIEVGRLGLESLLRASPCKFLISLSFFKFSRDIKRDVKKNKELIQNLNTSKFIVLRVFPIILHSSFIQQRSEH